MSKRTKAGRKASFRAFNDPSRPEEMHERWMVGFRKRAAAAMREADERVAHDSTKRFPYRSAAMFAFGAVADKVMGAR